MLHVLLIEVIVIVAYMTVWFCLAQALRRNDVADIAWGIGFIVTAISATVSAENVTTRGLLTTCLVIVWGVRLASHVFLRNRGKHEDPRYRKWRQDWGKHAVIRAFFQVFLLQGVLIIIISLPVTMAITSGQSSLSLLDILGVCIWVGGFAFESVGDYQLMRYKRDPANQGKIMTQGLWKYTRHPNYFGEVALWWGVYLIAVSVPLGWATIIGPVTITFLILKVSGIPLLEEKYINNPEFQAYKSRTSGFFPLPPRKET